MKGIEMATQQAAPLGRQRLYIRAALHEESTNGWIWCNKQANLRPRSLVKIENLSNGRSVVCEHREIDDYFLDTYNNRKANSVDPLQLDGNPMVMSFWYRSALGIETIGSCEDLKLYPAPKYLGELRAGAEHADPAVRLGTRVGVLSLWLGLDGLALGALSLIPHEYLFSSTVVALAFMIVSGFFLRWTVQGISR